MIVVECQRPLEIGRQYEITLQTGDEGLELKSDVRWCDLVRTERSNSEVIPVYRSGLDFRSALEEKDTIAEYEARVAELREFLIDEQQDDFDEWGRSPATADAPNAPDAMR